MTSQLEHERPAAQERTCDKHGPYTAKHFYGRTWAGCPTCQRVAGEAWEAREAEKKQLEADRVAAHRLQRNLRLSGIKTRFQPATFENFLSTLPAQREILTACRKYAETFDPSAGGGLWLIGPVGVGKTHLGCAIVNYVVRQHLMGGCIHGVHEIVAMLRARWGVKGAAWGSDGIDTEAELLEHLASVPLLVVDEVGGTRGSDDELKNLFTIIDARYFENLPTVLMSNLQPAVIKAAVGDRSYDRLREAARMLVLDWPSHRGAAQC